MPLLVRQQFAQEVDDTRGCNRFLERREGFELAESFRVRARDDDDRDVRDEGIRPLARAERPAVHHRHAEIEDDDRDAEAGARQVSASWPLFASMTSNPSSPSSRAMGRRTAMSSSTTRTACI